jgi:hypothetical protein
MSDASTFHVLRILDRSGDTMLTYDPADPDALREVDARFARLMREGFVAFDVSQQPGRIVTAFDPSAREIIVAPRFAGG